MLNKKVCRLTQCAYNISVKAIWKSEGQVCGALVALHKTLQNNFRMAIILLFGVASECDFLAACKLTFTHLVSRRDLLEVIYFKALHLCLVGWYVVCGLKYALFRLEDVVIC